MLLQEIMNEQHQAASPKALERDGSRAVQPSDSSRSPVLSSPANTVQRQQQQHMEQQQPQDEGEEEEQRELDEHEQQQVLPVQSISTSPLQSSKAVKLQMAPFPAVRRSTGSIREASQGGAESVAAATAQIRWAHVSPPLLRLSCLLSSTRLVYSSSPLNKQLLPVTPICYACGEIHCLYLLATTYACALQ
jgi:hypothetical protein